MIIVTGLPRSGTSLMMRILESLNLEVTGDKFLEKENDDPKRKERTKYLNPDGFYEIRGIVGSGNIKEPEIFLGKVVKVVVPGVLRVPVEHIEKAIFCLRNPAEVIESQRNLISNIEVATPDGVKYASEVLQRSFDSYKRIISMVILASSEDFWNKTLVINYEDVLEKYDEQLEKISSFLGVPNTKVVLAKEELHRSKKVLECDEFTLQLYNAIKNKSFDDIKEKAQEYLQGVALQNTQWVDESEFQTYALSNISLHKSLVTNNKGLRDKMLFNTKMTPHYFDCPYYSRNTNEMYTIKRPEGLPDLTRRKVKCFHYKENKTLEFCHQCFIRRLLTRMQENEKQNEPEAI